MRKAFEARFPTRTLLSVFVIILGLIPAAASGRRWSQMQMPIRASSGGATLNSACVVFPLPVERSN